METNENKIRCYNVWCRADGMLMVSLYVKSHLWYKSGSKRANILL